MEFSEELAGRVRVLLSAHSVSETPLLGGKSFWVKEKLIVSIHGDDLLVRVPEEEYSDLRFTPGIKEYEFAGRPVPSWLIVGSEAIADETSLARWVSLGLKRLG